MSDPEIARRCTACGVSVREQAMFCPQCGNPITNRSENSTNTSLSETIADRPDLAMTQPLSAVVAPTPETAPTQALKAMPTQVSHRVVEGGVRGRVEKFRKVTSVVLDQAAYDPSIRFLLVAAGFFLLFLVLLILSKVLG